MGALWQYRWLVLVLLIAPTIAYCQYRAVERLATQRCANAGGTWDEERSECTGLPAPKAAGSGESDESDESERGETDEVVEATTDESAGTTAEPAQAEAADEADSAYDVQLLLPEGAGEARIDEPPGQPDEGSAPRDRT